MFAPAAARAETHVVTIRNGGGETIRGIYFGAAASSRLQHDLPQGAEARITNSSGCQADIRIAYASGRTEDHAGVDVCSDPHLTAGQDGTAGPPMAPQPAVSGLTASPKLGPKLITTAAPATPVRAPPPVVPPWTGKSITKRFGGMD